MDQHAERDSPPFAASVPTSFVLQKPNQSLPTAMTRTQASFNLRPLIPSWLDELKLSASEFRICAHLWRRAGKHNTCYPGAESMARDCRLSRDTVWKALRALERRGLLQRGKSGTRNSNTYRLFTPSSNSGIGGSIKGSLLAETKGRQAAEPDGRQLAESNGPQMAESGGREGIPVKEVQLKKSSEGGTHSSSLDLSDQDRQNIAQKLGLSESLVLPALTEFETYKRHFPADPRDCEAVIHYFLYQKPGKEWLRINRINGASITLKRSNEPADWRDRLEKHRPDCAFARDGIQAHKSWSQLDISSQNHILEILRTDSDSPCPSLSLARDEPIP